MRIGIVGRPQSGKTTLMQLLTQAKGVSPQKGAPSTVGVMEVPDERVLWLSSLFRPRKTTFARMDVQDIQPYKGQEFLNAVRNLDALIAVIPVFKDGGEEVSFLDDIETEFFVADLASVEGRLDRIRSNKAKPVSMAELPFLEKCREALDNGVPLSKVAFDPHEEDFVTNFAFYTRRPIVVAVNVSEASLLEKTYPGESAVEGKASLMGYPAVVFSGEVEPEIAALPEDDRQAFLQEYGLTEPGVTRIAKVCYEHLGLISFFTVGEDEVRAWTITRGTVAREAAGKIHTDLKKGFIRAEVIPYECLREHGTVKACRDKGLVRLEGKDYVVQDGDILTIRFNV
ncbi:MAG TPA: redox-regulated ATPase YchF [Firmicutes bacterium]|nr:redox-regulated ATPase YchF [Candidatus Fermentithermobacillaceae bacterium]